MKSFPAGIKGWWSTAAVTTIDVSGICWVSAVCPGVWLSIKSFHVSLEARRLFPLWGGLGWEFLPWHTAVALSFPSLHLGLCHFAPGPASHRRAALTWGLAHPCCFVSAGCPRDIFETWDVQDRKDLGVLSAFTDLPAWPLQGKILGQPLIFLGLNFFILKWGSPYPRASQ